jgi:hypothetical protein
MSDDAGCVLVLLVVVVSFLPFVLIAWVLWEMLKFIDEHPEEITAFFTGLATAIGAILLAPHYAAALVVLFLCRDVVVQFWPAAEFGEDEERTAVLVWVVLVPLLVGLFWLGLAMRGFALVIPAFTPVVLLGGVSTLTTLGCYYYVYFEHPPHHHNWPLFLAQEEHMWFDVRLAYIERRAQLQVWWHQLTVRNE